MTLIDTAYGMTKTLRINSWSCYRRLCNLPIVARQQRDVLGGPDKVTYYEHTGWSIDWQGNASRVWKEVASA